MAHDRHRGVHHSPSQQVTSHNKAIRVSPIARRSNENVEEDQEDSSSSNISRDQFKLRHKVNSDQDSSRDRKSNILHVPTA